MKLTQTEELVLRAIAHREMFGQQIAKAIFECCDRQIREGSLYPALRGLVAKKLATKTIEVANGTRRDYYRLTELGVDTLEQIDKGFEKLRKWEVGTMTNRDAENLAYDNTMIVDTDKPCVKCKYFTDDDGYSVCSAQKPPFYRGDYRIRNCDQDSCNSWVQKS